MTANPHFNTPGTNGHTSPPADAGLESLESALENLAATDAANTPPGLEYRVGLASLPALREAAGLVDADAHDVASARSLGRVHAGGRATRATLLRQGGRFGRALSAAAVVALMGVSALVLSIRAGGLLNTGIVTDLALVHRSADDAALATLSALDDKLFGSQFESVLAAAESLSNASLAEDWGPESDDEAPSGNGGAKGAM